MATGRRSIYALARTAVRACVGTRGSGRVVTRTFDLTGFDAVSASVFDVRIVNNGDYHVEVRADDNFFDLIDVRVSGDVLSLGLRPGTSLRGSYTLEASVTMPTLREVELNGAAKASLIGFDSLGAVELRLSGASRLRGTLGAAEIEATCSGASRLRLEGNAGRLRLEGSGASRIDLEGLRVSDAEVELSGASSADINSSECIDYALLSGASRLRYAGNPQLGHVRTSGASSFRRRD